MTLIKKPNTFPHFTKYQVFSFMKDRLIATMLFLFVAIYSLSAQTLYGDQWDLNSSSNTIRNDGTDYDRWVINADYSSTEPYVRLQTGDIGWNMIFTGIELQFNYSTPGNGSLNDRGINKFKFDNAGILSLGNGMNIRGSEPTIHFNDQNSSENEASIHVNDNKFYILGHSSTNSDSQYGGWDKIGSYWPFQIELDNDNINLGGHTHIREGFLHFGQRTDQLINLYSNDYGIGVQGNTEYFRSKQHFAWYRGGSHNDSELSPGGGTPDMVLRSGKLGIGTNDPGAKLTLDDGEIAIRNISDTAPKGIIFQEGITGRNFEMTYDGAGNGIDNKLLFKTDLGGGTIMSMKGNGNVGVGIENPRQKLDVDGIVRMGGLEVIDPVSGDTLLHVNDEGEVNFKRLDLSYTEHKQLILRDEGNRELILKAMGDNDDPTIESKSNHWFRIKSEDAIAFQTGGRNHNSTPNVYINKEGQVGIGTQDLDTHNLSRKLEVNGNIGAFGFVGRVLDLKDGDKNVEFKMNNDGDLHVWTSNINQDVYIGSAANIHNKTLNDQDHHFRLWVDQGIVSEDVAISNHSNWPDFVFKEGYQSMGLQEKEEYVKRHKHLPNVPGIKEITAKGYYQIHDLIRGQLQNIEELLLHTIEQEKKIEAQEGIIDGLIKRIERLETSANK